MSEITVWIDSDVREASSEVLDEMGMSMTTAIDIFLRRVARDRCIPFELSADPFYEPANIAHLERLKREAEAGRTRYEAHDLIDA